MCNLYSNTLPQEAMRRFTGALRDMLGNQPPLPAIFPDGSAPILRIGEDGARELVAARWGWSKAKFGWVTNIRNLDGWPWKTVLPDVGARCLVPATAFSEYHPTEKDEKGHKAAVWFRLSGEEPRPPFAFAGFRKRWDWEKDGPRKKADDLSQPVDAFAFLTCEPNDIVRPIHPKAMPVILRPEDFEQWLHGDAKDAAALQSPLSSDLLEIAFVGGKTDDGSGGG